MSGISLSLAVRSIAYALARASGMTSGRSPRSLAPCVSVDPCACYLMPGRSVARDRSTCGLPCHPERVTTTAKANPADLIIASTFEGCA